MEMKHSLIAASLLALTACGGGGSSETKSPVEIQPTPPAATISGKVIDGYVTGATVFLDLNGNTVLDGSEPSATTGTNGEYSLDLDAAQFDCQAYVPLVVDVPVGATDSDTGEVTEAYQLVFPPSMGSAIDTGDITDITPLTTVIWESIKSEFLLKDEDLDNPNLACDAIRDNHEKIDEIARHIEQTLNNIVAHYNISQDAIFADYIANGDSTTHELAVLIVKGLKKGFAESAELKQQHPNSYVDVKYLKTNDGWVRKEYIYTASGNDNSNGWSSHAKVESTTYSVSDDLETIGAQVDFYNRKGSTKNVGDDKIELATSEETCNTREYLNYYEKLGANEVHEREMTNITSTCANEDNGKYIFNMQWSDSDKRLGTIGQYIIRYDAETKQFMMFNDIERFDQNKNQLDFTAINAEIDGLNYHYDDDISDTTALYETFSFVILTKMVEENGLRVEYKKSMAGLDGWDLETTRFNADGTYSKECKAWDADDWTSC
jgi:hypothetical protein